MTGTPVHRAWLRMNNRCNNTHPANKYIERGITIGEEWRDFITFYRDMGPSYVKGLTLERIDNTKGYSKENCRWATQKEQTLNRSTTKLVTYGGETQPLAKLTDKLGKNYTIVWKRISMFGWSLEDALTLPTLTKQEVGQRSVKSSKHINNKVIKKGL
jgi:hypothetical protein